MHSIRSSPLRLWRFVASSVGTFTRGFSEARPAPRARVCPTQDRLLRTVRAVADSFGPGTPATGQPEPLPPRREAVALRDGSPVVACELFRRDEPAVETFYRGLDPATLSAVHGSSRAVGAAPLVTQEEALRELLLDFSATVAAGHALRGGGAVLGLREADGAQALVGLCHYVSTSEPRLCRAHRLVIHPSRRGRGAATLLQAAQLQHARTAGYSMMLIELDPTRSGDGMPPFVGTPGLRLIERAARQAGAEVDLRRLESHGVVLVVLPGG